MMSALVESGPKRLVCRRARPADQRRLGACQQAL